MKPGLLQKFKEALLSREVRRVLPTDMSTAELAELPAEILERATFSARTMSEGYLEAVEREVRAILEPRTERKELTTKDAKDAKGESEFRTVGQDKASARLELKSVWEALGYEAPAGKEGTLQDLSSDARINLVLEMNVDQARGFGQWRQGQDEDVLDLFPCSELFRAEDRVTPRDWAHRWREAASLVGDTDAMKVLGTHGRMIARKDSPIWEALSRFGTPYPSFDFNSGMWTRDVDREEAVSLGVIGEWDVIVPQRRSFEMEEAA